MIPPLRIKDPCLNTVVVVTVLEQAWVIEDVYEAVTLLAGEPLVCRCLDRAVRGKEVLKKSPILV